MQSNQTSNDTLLNRSPGFFEYLFLALIVDDTDSVVLFAESIVYWARNLRSS